LDKKVHDELKQKLEVLNKEIDGKNKEELERKRAVRYHKVKFFERRKVERKIDTVTKKLSQEKKDEVKAKELREELARLEDDLIYVMYFPKAKKYISLFAQVDEKTKAKIDLLRVEARKAKEEEKLNLANASKTASSKASKTVKSNESKPTAAATAAADSSSDSSSSSSDSSDSSESEEEEEDAFFVEDTTQVEEEVEEKEEPTVKKNKKQKK
jgi:hypothetical protein